MKYDRALADFRRFLLSHNLSADTLTGGDIYDYAVESLWRGQSPATVIQRLNILNSIFRRPASAQAPVPGPREMARLIGEPSFELPPLLKTAVYERCLTTLRTIASDGNATTSGADLLLYAVLNPGIPPEKLILLTKSDIGESKGLSRQILRRNAASRRKYIFDLRQSYRTLRQIAADLTESLRGDFGHLATGGDISLSHLAGSLRAAMSPRTGDPRPEGEIEQLLTQGQTGWYVLRMRRGVSFDELQQRIVARIHPSPELFYPIETVRKKLRGRNILVEQPFISQTVFIRTRREDLLPLMREIGDLAWCVRLSREADAAPAVVPRREMTRFQQAIGIFTPDTELYLPGTLKARPGEKVILIEAGYTDRPATIEDVVPGDSGTVLFRVRLTTDFGYEWRATVDSRQTHPLTPRPVRQCPAPCSTPSSTSTAASPPPRRYWRRRASTRPSASACVALPTACFPPSTGGARALRSQAWCPWWCR